MKHLLSLLAIAIATLFVALIFFFIVTLLEEHLKTPPVIAYTVAGLISLFVINLILPSDL